VVQVDAHFAVIVPFIAKRVLDLGNAVVRRGVEVVLAHRLGGRTVEVDLVVVEDHLLPTRAIIEGKATVLGIPAGDLVAADEVREGALPRGTEGVLGGLGRLEEHIRATVAVEFVCRLLSCVHTLATGKARA